MIEITVRPGEQINLGRKGENRARRIVFDVAQWERIFGEGTVYLLHQRKGDEVPYPVAVEREENKVYWEVGSADVACPGSGSLELQYRKEDVVVKSEVFHTRTWHSLDEAGEHPGDPEAGWMEQVLALAQRTKESAGRAETAEVSAKSSAADAQTAAEQAETAQRKAEEAAERAEAATEQGGNADGGVGKSLAGKLVSLPDGGSATAKEGAEIFNDYEGTAAVGSFSHAEGSGTTATGEYSHAEGQKSKATGDCAHSEGSNTTASGMYSHAEGQVASARGDYSHAEGQFSTTDGRAAHAEGHRTYAKGDYSHAEGYYTTASGESQHVQGRANVEDTENRYAHIVGNGVNGAKRSNAHTVDWDGLGWFAGGLKVGGTSQDDPDAKTVATLEDLQNIGCGSVPKPLTVDYFPEGYPYVEDGEVKEVFPETTLTVMDGQAIIPNAVDVSVGGIYTVTWNGVEYECIGLSQEMDGVVMTTLGDPTMSGNGDPFFMVFIPAELVASAGAGGIIQALDGTVTLSIKGKSAIVHTMDEKFLPNTGTPTIYLADYGITELIADADPKEVCLEADAMNTLAKAMDTGRLFVYCPLSDGIGSIDGTLILGGGGGFCRCVFDVFGNKDGQLCHSYLPNGKRIRVDLIENRLIVAYLSA